jgi:hypothetical protein
MARSRAAKAPKHYQDNGKRNIENYKKQIINCKAEIEKLKAK